MEKDFEFIRRTLRLAKKAQGWTSPNPLVGAVIVKNGRVLGEGYHRAAGEAHAEIEALNSCEESPKGATVYLNLEPCCHWGRTPPCTNALIAAKIRRVVYSIRDPSPKANGKGAAMLKRAGIEATEGVLAKEAMLLNEQFVTFHKKRRPFVAVKFAASLDGKIATETGNSKWITNEKARKHARSLRGLYQAILVGINTVLKDNPHLGTRGAGAREPIRIILDSKLRIPVGAQVLRDKNIIIATGKSAERSKLRKLTRQGFTVLQFPHAQVPLKGLLYKLAKREIISVLVEGGGEVLGSFVDARLVDKVYAYHAPILIGGKNSVSAIAGSGVQKISNALKLERITHKTLGDNLLTIGYPSFTRELYPARIANP